MDFSKLLKTLDFHSGTKELRFLATVSVLTREPSIRRLFPIQIAKKKSVCGIDFKRVLPKRHGCGACEGRPLTDRKYGRTFQPGEELEATL